MTCPRSRSSARIRWGQADGFGLRLDGGAFARTGLRDTGSERGGRAPASWWQPIATAPKDGTSFLAWDRDHEQMAVCYVSADRTLCFEANEVIVERDDADSVGFWPSHWRPRPAPPT